RDFRRSVWLLPLRGRLHSVRRLSAPARAPAATRSQYRHALHSECAHTFLLSLGAESCCWSSLRHRRHCTSSLSHFRKNNPPQRSQYFNSSLATASTATGMSVSSVRVEQHKSPVPPGNFGRFSPGLVFLAKTCELFSFTPSVVPAASPHSRRTSVRRLKYPSSYPDFNTLPFCTITLRRPVNCKSSRMRSMAADRSSASRTFRRNSRNT